MAVASPRLACIRWKVFPLINKWRSLMLWRLMGFCIIKTLITFKLPAASLEQLPHNLFNRILHGIDQHRRHAEQRRFPNGSVTRENAFHCLWRHSSLLAPPNIFIAASSHFHVYDLILKWYSQSLRITNFVDVISWGLLSSVWQYPAVGAAVGWLRGPEALPDRPVSEGPQVFTIR